MPLMRFYIFGFPKCTSCLSFTKLSEFMMSLMFLMSSGPKELVKMIKNASVTGNFIEDTLGRKVQTCCFLKIGPMFCIMRRISLILRSSLLMEGQLMHCIMGDSVSRSVFRFNATHLFSAYSCTILHPAEII